jgi:hypothetical protein
MVDALEVISKLRRMPIEMKIVGPIPYCPIYVQMICPSICPRLASHYVHLLPFNLGEIHDQGDNV